MCTAPWAGLPVSKITRARLRRGPRPRWGVFQARPISLTQCTPVPGRLFFHARTAQKESHSDGFVFGDVGHRKRYGDVVSSMRDGRGTTKPPVTTIGV